MWRRALSVLTMVLVVAGCEALPRSPTAEYEARQVRLLAAECHAVGMGSGLDALWRWEACVEWAEDVVSRRIGR